MKKGTVNKLDKLIADRMFWLRTEVFAMSQADFARAMLLNNFQTISKYENGAMRPSLRRCKQLIELCAQRGKAIDYKWLRPDLF